MHRDNCSTNAFLVAAGGSKDFFKGICAALCSVGEVHAPLGQTYDFLLSALETPKLVPGWGNSFVRGEIDPIWMEVWKVLRIVSPELIYRMESVTEELHARGKFVFPNPSALTAACCIALQVPKELCGLFFLQGRAEGWASLYYEHVLGGVN